MPEELVHEEHVRTDLANEMKELKEHLVRVNTPKHRFALGLIGGVGTALGASIIAAPLVLALSEVLKRVGIQ